MYIMISRAIYNTNETLTKEPLDGENNNQRKRKQENTNRDSERPQTNSSIDKKENVKRGTKNERNTSSKIR